MKMKYLFYEHQKPAAILKLAKLIYNKKMQHKNRNQSNTLLTLTRPFLLHTYFFISM